MKYFLPLSVNNDATVISTTYDAAGQPEETHEGKEYLPSSSHQIALAPYGEPQGTSGCENTLAPDS